MPQDSITELKLKYLESQIKKCATKEHLDQIEERLAKDIAHLKQNLKTAGIVLLVVLSGTGVLSSDIIKLFGAA